MKRRYVAISSAAVLVAGMTVVGSVSASAGQDSTAAAAASSSVRGWAGPQASSVAAAERAAQGRITGPSAAAMAGETLVVVEAPFSPRREAFVDVGASGDSPGDFFIAEGRILDRSGSRMIGSDALRCEAGVRTFTCEATLVVTGKGKIRVAGTLFSNRDNVLPVTGGTDAYAGVGGQVTFFNLGHGRTALIFDLTR
ncbi:MAG TPA: hypothetical protein VFJ97_00905 [Dermatophilaceae bacterium]|nr:hypothetical protein [Dermatophilaceae bacterium]